MANAFLSLANIVSIIIIMIIAHCLLLLLDRAGATDESLLPTKIGVGDETLSELSPPSSQRMDASTSYDQAGCP